MLKGETIYLRMLEPEDWELTYKWHNDTEIQRLTCGPIRIVSKEIEKAWVNSKATNNRNDLYLAICLNSDDSMIGYISIGEIDHFNQSCSWSGVVIGNKQYRDGFVFAELLIIGMVLDVYSINLTADELRKCTTIEDVYNIVKNKTNV